MFDKTDEDIDPGKPVKITEAISGLTVEADMTPNLKTAKLVSDDPVAYRDVTVSPLKILIRSPEEDPFSANKVITNDPTVYSAKDPVAIFVHKKDGSVVEASHAQGIPHWESGSETPTRVDSYARLGESP